MKIGILVFGIILVVLGIQLAITYGIYSLMMWAGAPKYVSVALAFGYFVFAGWIVNFKSN